jgi:hypothetical protein
MKKNKVQDDFLENLSNVPIIVVACEKSGISRNSIYRWRKEDPIFARKMEQAFADGVALVNDMSESQLLTMIKEKNWSAIRFWLSYRNDNYKNKVEVTTIDDSGSLTPSQEKTVKEALKLASIVKEDSIKKINIQEKDE